MKAATIPVAAFAILHLNVRVSASLPSTLGAWTTSADMAAIVNPGLKSLSYRVIALTKFDERP
jgi:hypothetical protein